MERSDKKKKSGANSAEDQRIVNSRSKGTILFVKNGRGNLRVFLDGRKKSTLVRPGQMFWMRPEKISESQRDIIVPVPEANWPVGEEV